MKIFVCDEYEVMMELLRLGRVKVDVSDLKEVFSEPVEQAPVDVMEVAKDTVKTLSQK